MIILVTMASIQASYNWAIATCAADNVGYSQKWRNQQIVNGITYYDCSSFIFYSLIAGGWDMAAIWGSWPFTTSNMGGCLAKMGFTLYDPSINWRPGDILIKSGHTEMAFDLTRSMGAHTDKVPLAEQVSINSNDSRGSGWYALYRWGDGALNEWEKGNRYLSIGEMQNNASIFIAYFSNLGYSQESISGMLGNIQVESTINPGLWQGRGEPSPVKGFGLVQWTPSTKFTIWADEKGYGHDDGNAQCEWINTQMAPSSEWIPTADYPMSWNEFIVSKESPEYLARVFLFNFERPADPDIALREANALYWYKWLNGEYVPPPNPPQQGDRLKMPIYFYIRRKI